MSRTSICFSPDLQRSNPDPFFAAIENAQLKLTPTFQQTKFNEFSILAYEDFHHHTPVEGSIEEFWPQLLTGCGKAIRFHFVSKTSAGRDWKEHFTLSTIDVPEFGKICLSTVGSWNCRNAFGNLLASIGSSWHEFDWLICRATGCQTFLSGSMGCQWSRLTTILDGEKPEHFDPVNFSAFSGLSSEATTFLLSEKPEIASIDLRKDSTKTEKLVYFDPPLNGSETNKDSGDD